MMKKLAVLLAFLMACSMAFAVEADVNVLNRDANYYYPSGSTIVIQVRLADGDVPADANLGIAYILDGDIDTNPRIPIIDVNGVDGNVMNYCALPVTATAQTCSYTWTLPANLDGNYSFDVNFFDIETGDDINGSSLGLVYIDTNACETGHSITGDDINFTVPLCTGYSAIFGTGTATIRYGRSRQGRCPDNYTSYNWVPFGLSFGEFVVCYYSTDTLGNVETIRSFSHTADSDAVNIALLTELALAALALVVIAGFIVTRELSPEIMIALTIAAIIIVIVIVIFAVIL